MRSDHVIGISAIFPDLLSWVFTLMIRDADGDVNRLASPGLCERKCHEVS